MDQKEHRVQVSVVGSKMTEDASSSDEAPDEAPDEALVDEAPDERGDALSLETLPGHYRLPCNQ